MTRSIGQTNGKNMIDVYLSKIYQPFFCDDLIRLGRDNDGGYLVNRQDVLKTARLLSLGVEDDISFEKDFVNLNNCPVDAYDGNTEHTFDFFTGQRKIHKCNIGYRTGRTKLSELLKDEDRNVFFKCDIEGSEYEIVDEIIEHSHKFSGIVIEFHDSYKHSLYNEIYNFISKIDLRLVHTHMNNIAYAKAGEDILPGCIELTFSSSDNIKYSDIILPHKLDMPNTPSREEFRIIF